MRKAKKTVALMAAAVMAASAFTALSGSAMAVNYATQPIYGYTWYGMYTGRYYQTPGDAIADGNPQTMVQDASYYVSSTPGAMNTSSTSYPWYNSYTKLYYPTQAAAAAASSYGSVYNVYTGTAVSNSSSYYVSASYPWRNSYTGRYYPSEAAARAASAYGTVSYAYSGSTVYSGSSSSPSASYPWRNSYTGRFYPTEAAARSASPYGSVTYAYSTSSPSYSTYYYGSAAYPWYNTYTQQYYATEAAARAASPYGSVYYAYSGYSTSGASAQYPWFNTYTQRYYASEAAATAASSYGYVYYAYTGTDAAHENVKTIGQLYYVSSTDTFFSDYRSALIAANNKASKLVFLGPIYSGTKAAAAYYCELSQLYYSNFASAFYAAKYDAGRIIQTSRYSTAAYSDPYYATYLNLKSDKTLKAEAEQIQKASTDTTASASVTGTPYISGSRKRAGWTNIVTYINASSSGDTVGIIMNGATKIDSAALAAIKGRNISLRFTLDNGAKWTINGRDVESTNTVDITTEYNAKKVPSNLVKKAAKGALTKAQISLADGSYGFDAKVSVKFNANKYAGKKAYIYRYDDAANSLKSVSKVKVSSTGYCTFETAEGGAYLIVVK